MAALRILVTSAGRRVELLNCFRSAAASLGVELVVLACDLRPEASAACHSADATFAVPFAGDAGYADAVLDICRREGVTLAVPTIDPELLPLSLAYDAFGHQGCEIAVSGPQLIDIARDKLATADFLASHDIRSPRTMTAEAAISAGAGWHWPTFAKPRHGSAGRLVRAVAGPDEIDTVAEPMIVQELLRGTEYTVNVYFNRRGELRCAVPHQRLAVRAGEVEKGMTRRSDTLAAIARDLAAALPRPRGALCFQAMVGDDGSASVFEINARFGGGYPLAHRAGATFTRWLIEEALGLPTSAGDGWRPGVMMLRYDAAVFVDS